MRPFPVRKFKEPILKSPKRDGILVVDNNGSVTRIHRRAVEFPVILVCALIVITVFSLKMYFTMRSQTVQLENVISQQQIQLRAQEEKYNTSVQKLSDLEIKFQEVQDSFNKLKK